jgi:hypothetical protein
MLVFFATTPPLYAKLTSIAATLPNLAISTVSATVTTTINAINCYYYY